VALTLTVPFPCKFKNKNSQMKSDCPFNIEMQVPHRTSGTCQSRLASAVGCGVQIEDPNTWNETHFLTIIHKDTGNYKLTPSESERKVFLKTYDFPISYAWAGMKLPVINVNVTY
jgi:hypothetical protein